MGDRGFGRGQIIWRNEDGVLACGSEPRCDGQAAAW
jgi:gamma-glutamyltranspeptidase/glutathione hydrolase